MLVVYTVVVEAIDGPQQLGRIHTPWTTRLDCPRQGRLDGPTCRIEVFEPWVAALDGITEYQKIEVLYWLHLSRRDIVRQSPRNDGVARGAFSLRTPVRRLFQCQFADPGFRRPNLNFCCLAKGQRATSIQFLCELPF